MSVSHQDPSDHQVPMGHLVYLAGLVLQKGPKVIQGSQDQQAPLEYLVLMVEMDIQALLDKKETHLPMSPLG